MRRTAIMLLQHGPLKLSDFTEITGWSYKKSANLLRELWLEGVLTKPSSGVYALKEGAHE